MPGLSVYSRNKLLDLAFGGTAFTRPSTVYFESYTTAPNDIGSGGVAVSGNGYPGRAAVANTTAFWTAATGRTKSNAAGLTLGTCTGGTWGTIVALGVWDASSGGNLLAVIVLNTPRVTVSGKRVRLRAGQVSVAAGAGAWSDAFAHALLDHLFGGGNYTPPATWYGGLLTSSAELSGNGYARVGRTNDAAAFPAASDGAKATLAAFEFGPATGSNWAEATRLGLFTASSGGSAALLGPLNANVTVTVGGTATADAGALGVGVEGEQAPSIDWANTRIVIDGDSLTDLSYNETENQVDAWPMRLGDVLLPTTDVIVHAVAGSSMANFEGEPWLMSPTRTNAFDDDISPTKFNIAILWCATNDLAQGASGSATLALVEEWVADRRAAGWDYIVVINCAWRFEIASDPDRATFNAGLSGVGADRVIDMNTALGNATSNPTYFHGDLIHLLQPGMTAAANTVHADLVAAFAA